MSHPRASWVSGTTLFLITSVAGDAGCSSPRHAPVALDLVSTDLVDPGGPPRSADDVPQQLPDPDAGYRAEFFAREGVYLSGRSHWSRLGGDFDGETSLDAGRPPPNNEVISIPDADDGYGYELALGWMSKGWAMEMSYTEIEYDGSIGGADSSIDYGAVTFNGLHYWRANEPIQPYLMIGLLFSWADLEDASQVGLARSNAELSGFGIDGGGGLAWWLGHSLALDVRALFVYQEFDDADGASISGTIDDPVEGPSYSLSVGLTWVLGKTGG